MINPFIDETDLENQTDTDKFIKKSTYTNTQNKTTISNRYIIIGLIYLLEIFTSVLGGINNQKTIGLKYSGLTIQYWLIISGIYNICGLIIIYQFNYFF